MILTFEVNSGQLLESLVFLDSGVNLDTHYPRWWGKCWTLFIFISECYDFADKLFCIRIKKKKKMFENCKFFNQNFGGVIVGRCDIFYYAMDLLGNKSLKTHSTSSENNLKKKNFDK